MIRANGTPAGHVTFQALGGDVPSQSHSSEWDGVPAPRGTAVCPDCGTPVRKVWDDDICALHATVSLHPVDRAVALAAIATGRGAVVHIDARRHSYWRRLDAGNLSSANLAAGRHHLDHACGKDPEEPPPPRPAYTVPDQPPF